MKSINQLNIPNRLYGREQDLLTLLESFDRIGQGQGEILLVPGYSGVGKTVLVKELQKPVREKNGFFVSGKFDQYKQNIPYFAFRQALAELCRELKSGDSQQRNRYKTEILQAVGSLGQLLVDMAPEFESLLGVQPSLGDISPQEARYRFAGVFQNFLKVICLPEHPLVLFIDDWQWADAASFELLKLIQVGVTLRYIVIIVSYRGNEVTASHPMTTTVDELQRQSVPLKTLELNNITESDVQRLVIDNLKPAPENIKELGTFIYNKTKGNPFFVRSFLNFLNEFNLIRFDNKLGRWQWIKDEINQAELPNDVADLFVMKLKGLDKDARNLFSLASCLGNRFDLVSLSIISGLSTEECQALFASDEAKTMLLPINEDGNQNQKDNFPVSVHFMFLHDRVQQAAFSLIEKNELPVILLKIGRLLLKNLPPESLAERFFEVVNDLNEGLSLIQDNTERVQIIELNLSAAQKAYAATAYGSALMYCRAAHQILDLPEFEEYFWLNHHDLAIQLFKEIAECEFLEGEVSIAEKSIQQSLTHARTPIEKANILNILIVHYTLASRYSEAISWGRQALAELGISLPNEGFDEARDQEIKLVRKELGNRLISSLVDLPVMSNSEMLMACKILITIGPPCYRSHQRLWSVIVPKVVNLTLRYGNIPQVGYSHTAFGGLLGWVDSDYATAKEFGKLATQLMTETFHSPSEQSVFYLMIGSSIRHWFKHLRFGTQDYKDAYEIGVQSGNMQYAAYAFGHNMYSSFYQGVPFDSLIAETEQSLEFSRTRLNQWAIDLLEGGLNIFGFLSGVSKKDKGNNTWSEEKYLKNLNDHHNIQVECKYKVMRTSSLLMLGQFDRALISSEEAEPLIYTVGTQGLLP
ncbi:MAG: AAA family ATPase, partial [Bacteroidales bacterium]|nr:AAA family ATPase [Bacteroidales bacterium]